VPEIVRLNGATDEILPVQAGSHDLLRFLCYLGIAVLSSGLKVNLPGVTGNMSVNFLFVLIGIVDMSLAETLAIGCIGTLVYVAIDSKIVEYLARELTARPIGKRDDNGDLLGLATRKIGGSGIQQITNGTPRRQKFDVAEQR